MSRSAQRIAWVDTARFVAISFVVFGHTYALAPARLISYAYSFHLAVFWFLSGSLRSPPDGLKRSVGRDFKRLMVPYFFFGTVVFAYRLGASLGHSFLMMVVGGADPWASFLKDVQYVPNLYWRLLLDLETKMTTPLWFLPALFLVSVAFVLTAKRRKLHVGAVVLAVVVCALSLNRSLTGRITPTLLRTWVLAYGVSVPFGFVLFSAGYWSRSWLFENLSRLKKTAPLLLAVDVGLFLLLPEKLLAGKFLLAFAGVAAWLGVALLLPPRRHLLYLGRMSLVVLALHEVFFDVVYRLNGLLAAAFHVPPVFLERSASFGGQLASSVALTAMAVLLCLPAAALLERYCPWGLGRFQAPTLAGARARFGLGSLSSSWVEAAGGSSERSMSPACRRPARLELAGCAGVPAPSCSPGVEGRKEEEGKHDQTQ